MSNEIYESGGSYNLPMVRKILKAAGSKPVASFKNAEDACRWLDEVKDDKDIKGEREN